LVEWSATASPARASVQPLGSVTILLLLYDTRVMPCFSTARLIRAGEVKAAPLWQQDLRHPA
jgi:hypothetical protein